MRVEQAARVSLALEETARRLQDQPVRTAAVPDRLAQLCLIRLAAVAVEASVRAVALTTRSAVMRQTAAAVEAVAARTTQRQLILRAVRVATVKIIGEASRQQPEA
jgi:hypothetical protein